MRSSFSTKVELSANVASGGAQNSENMDARCKCRWIELKIAVIPCFRIEEFSVEVEYLESHLLVLVVAEQDPNGLRTGSANNEILRLTEIFKKHGHHLRESLKTEFQFIVIVAVRMGQRIEERIGLVLIEASADARNMVHLFEGKVVRSSEHLGAIALVSALDNPAKQYTIALLISVERLQDGVCLLAQHQPRHQNEKENEQFLHGGTKITRKLSPCCWPAYITRFWIRLQIMRKDIHIPKVTDVSMAVVRETEGSDVEWGVYLINHKKVALGNIIVASKGYGTINEEAVKTSVLRHFFEELQPDSFKKVEKIMPEMFGLNNEYMLTFYIDGVIYDRKFIFVPDSVVENNLIQIPLIDRPGILIR